MQQKKMAFALTTTFLSVSGTFSLDLTAAQG